MKPRFTSLPAESRLHHYVSPGDFLDCVVVPLEETGKSISEIAQLVFGRPPAIMQPLLTLRNRLVAPFGVRSTAEIAQENADRQRLGDSHAPLSPGDYLSFFQVRELYDDEIILGEKDRHLDFRATVFRPREGQHKGQVFLGSWVHRTNLFGHVYLATIMPFHRMIVKQMAANILSAT